LALNQSIQTVCIDEAVGRRIARLNNLSVTGSIGILLRAKKEGYPLSIKQAIENMLNHNIRLSETVIKIALREAGENHG
jgi:predicted nucleic acid-binding protein